MSVNSSTTRKLTQARRDKLEIDEWARTCDRPVSQNEIRVLRKCRRVIRQSYKLEADYARVNRMFSKSAAASGKSTTKPKPS